MTRGRIRTTRTVAAGYLAVALAATRLSADSAADSLPVLVMGIKATLQEAHDPTNPIGMPDYVGQFGAVLAMSHRERGGARPRPETWGDFAADIARDYRTAASHEIVGRLSDRAREVLKPLRGAPRNLIIAHSWGAAAVLTAIEDGYIPAPKQLVIVAPPQFTAAGAHRWRALSVKHPETKVDLYIGRRDIIERVRQNIRAPIGYRFNELRIVEEALKHPERLYLQDALAELLLPDPLEFIGGGPEIQSVASSIFPFIDPRIPGRVTVRTIDGRHVLRDFMEFAERNGLYGIRSDPTRRPRPLPTTPLSLRIVNQAVSQYAYLERSVPLLAEASALSRGYRERAALQVVRDLAELGERRQQHRAALENARWDYLLAVVQLACSSPENMETLESQGSVPTVLVHEGYLRSNYGRARERMTACERDVVEAILAAPRPLSAKETIAQARAYRLAHPEPPLLYPVALFFKKAGEFVASVGRGVARGLEDFFESGEGSSSSTSDDYRQYRERNSGSGSSGSSNVPDDWSSLRQLRGIASGSLKFP